LSDDQTFTKEEVERISKDAAESAAADAVARFQAQQQYGTPAGAGGGSPSRPTQRSTSQEAEDFIHDRLKKGDGLGDSAGKLAFARWVGPRIADAAEASINHSSYRSFSRQSVDDRKVQDDRKPNRGGRGSV
jgi:hypothetical protein